MQKQTLRKEILTLRENQTPAEIIEKNKQIFDILANWQVFKSADAVLIYMDFRSEVQTRQIVDYCLENNKDVIVPVVKQDTKQIVLVAVDNDTTFVKSKLGILEPVIEKDSVRTLYDIDLVLAPGVAFDQAGNRLGYGGGYYDRLLAAHSEIRHLIKVYGLAFDCQLVDDVPTDKTDCKMDGVITEKQIYHCKK